MPSPSLPNPHPGSSAVQRSTATASQVLTELLEMLPDDHLVARAPAVETPATLARDAAWLREQIRLRGYIWGIDDQFVLGTLWWYSASTWLVIPTVTSWFSTGRALSARLDDLLLFHHPDSRISGARSTRLGPDTLDELGSQLRESMGEVISTVASIIGKGERRLWSFVVDAITGRMLWAAEQTRRTEVVEDAAERLVAAIGQDLPRPRLTRLSNPTIGELSGLRVRRGSCCLLYQVPENAKCRGCPRQLPADRLRRLAVP